MNAEGYLAFERQYLAGKRFWRAPVDTLRDTPLFNLFVQFAQAFPDHPSELNTTFYLAEWVNVEPLMADVILWCDHFEHASLDDVRELVSFMHSAQDVLSSAGEASRIEVLDGIRDTVVLSFAEPPDGVRHLLKARGVEGAA